MYDQNVDTTKFKGGTCTGSKGEEVGVEEVGG